DHLADQPAAEMRVAEDRSADRAGRARPCFEARTASIDRPSDEPVDRHRPIRPYVRVVYLADLAAARANHEPAYAGVRHRHVRSAAEHRDGQLDLRREPPRREKL